MSNISEKVLFLIIIVGLIFSAWVILSDSNDDNPFSQEDNITEAGDFESYDSIVVFRNDDVDIPTEQFKDLNNVFVNNEIPITHGIVPEWFKHKSEDYNAHCEEMRSIKNRNEDLVDFAAHGYSHNGSEFTQNASVLSDKTNSIDNFFSECLNSTPKTFIPPHNAYSTTAMHILRYSGYDVLSAERTSHIQENEVALLGEENILEDRKVELGKSSQFVSNWETSPTETHGLEKLKSDFDESIENNRIHVQLMHYKAFNDEDLENLESLIEYMDDEDVKFMNFKTLKNNIANNKVLSDGDQWILKE